MTPEQISAMRDKYAPLLADSVHEVARRFYDLGVDIFDMLDVIENLQSPRVMKWNHADGEYTPI